MECVRCWCRVSQKALLKRHFNIYFAHLFKIINMAMIHIRVYPMTVAPGHQTSYFTSVVVLLVLLDIDNWGVMTQIEPNTHMLV